MNIHTQLYSLERALYWQLHRIHNKEGGRLHKKLVVLVILAIIGPAATAAANSGGAGTRRDLLSASDVELNEDDGGNEPIVWYVKPEATGTGLSWSDAGPLQRTVGAADTGDEIWVAEGDYTATTDPVLTMKAGVAIYGGFKGTETAREQRDWIRQVTVIDGKGERTCVIGDSDAMLDGFTIKGGHAPLLGGGMYNEYVAPTVRNCVFADNFQCGMANYHASPTVINSRFVKNPAGMINAYSSPVVDGCMFKENRFLDNAGSGMFNLYNSSPEVTRCTFLENFAYSGGGMHNEDHSSPAVSNCVFTRNLASSEGGGMYNDEYSSPSVTNCRFTENLSKYGGGMSNTMFSFPVIINCTFTRNTAAIMGGAVGGIPSPSIVITNCIFWNNKALHYPEIDDSYTVQFSCIQGGYLGQGNIHDDPLFVGMPFSLYLRTGSPCLDSGTSSTAPLTDIEGRQRPAGAGIDMGAYEGAVVAGDIMTLDIANTPADGGLTIPPKGVYSYARGEVAHIQAQGVGSRFAYWTGDTDGEEPFLDLTMDSQKTITAHFAENIYRVTAVPTLIEQLQLFMGVTIRNVTVTS